MIVENKPKTSFKRPRKQSEFSFKHDSESKDRTVSISSVEGDLAEKIAVLPSRAPRIESQSDQNDD